MHGNRFFAVVGDVAKFYELFVHAFTRKCTLFNVEASQ